MLVDGEIGIGDGWFLNLDETYIAAEHDDGSISFSQELRMVLPQTISWDPTSTTLTSEQILMDQIDKLRTELTDLGPVTGRGWVGHLFRQAIDPQNGEYELIAPLAAEGTLLNLGVRFIGPDEEDGARRVVEAVVHEPETRDAMNEQIRKQMGIE